MNENRRRWFQFRLRTLLITVLVLSLPLSWIAVRMKKAKTQAKVVEAIERAGGFACFSSLPPIWIRATPRRVRDCFANDFLYDVAQVSLEGTNTTNAELEQLHLERLPYLEDLYLKDTKVGNAGLKYLGGLTTLKTLTLGETEITDSGLRHLNNLGNLEYLSLCGTEIGDAGLEQLQGLTNLRFLYLSYTKITDTGLEHLRGLSKLEEIFIDNTGVTPEGVKTFQEGRPNCKIQAP